MRKWECDVCGYIHKDEGPPEKCPVCEAPRKIFKEIVEEPQGETGGAAAGDGMKKWQCTICGHAHTGTVPPEKCLICDAPGTMFAEMEKQEHGGAGTAQGKRWRCAVCGYIHNGDDPPEKCPICAAPKGMFVEIDEEGKAKGEPATSAIESLAAAVVGKNGKMTSPSMIDRFASLILKLHLHPITVHFPNGVLPVVVVFLGLSVVFNIISLETAAYYNMIFVLLMLPLVLLTGFCEWQKRYKGHKSAIFIVKILCALIVLATTNVLVFWRLLDPAVLAEGSPSRLYYLGVVGVMLVATALAGHLGGKLVFGPRG